MFESSESVLNFETTIPLAVETPLQQTVRIHCPMKSLTCQPWEATSVLFQQRNPLFSEGAKQGGSLEGGCFFENFDCICLTKYTL